MIAETDTLAVTRFLLVRHGQTEWNRVERFRGRADVPLNEAGLAQAQATGERIAREWRPAAVFASPLSRALRTAEAIASPFGLPVQVQEELADLHYGEWQGLTPAEARLRWPEAVEAWYRHPQEARIPGGETLADLRARAMSNLQGIQGRHRGQTVVVVAHTVVNRVLLLGVLGLGDDRFWRLGQEPCAINSFE